jgi:phospholipid transport system substrate-binding protein
MGMHAILALTLLFAGSPMSMLRKSNEEIRTILKQQKGESAATPEQKQKIKQIVNGFLDYEELAKRSLAGEWDKLTGAQRTEFVHVFRDLIERNYVKQLRSNVNYQIDYKDEQVDGSEAVVHSIVKAERKGRKADTTVDYKLAEKGGGKWAVYDVITDDVSLLRNYRSEFGRIIKRDGFPTLLAKMKKKLAETTE